MNLLDQLATFCPTSVSINLLNASYKQSKQHARPTRHHSVFEHHKIHDNRNARSIDKIQTYTPLNKTQQKKRILIKLSKTLFNKARKHFYTFWVNFQHAVKNKKVVNKEECRSQGAQKIISFIIAYQTKDLQSKGLSIAFPLINQYSKLKHIENCLTSALEHAVMHQKHYFLKLVQQRQSTQLKLDIFINSIEIGILNKRKNEAMYRLLDYCNKKKMKKSIACNKSINFLQVEEICLSVAKSINLRCCYEKFRFGFDLQLPYEPIIQIQKRQKIFGKLPIDNSVENTADIGDNHLIFIQSPEFKENNCQTLYANNYCLTLPICNLKTKRSTSRPQLQSYSQFLDFGSPRSQINLIDKEQTLKKQYLTPKHRSISTASIFNVDESRMSKLQKKIFGEGAMKENKQSSNGQDWKSDRKALQQILCNINYSGKEKRNSSYMLEIEKLNEKIEYYREKTVQRENQKLKKANCEEKQRSQNKEKQFHTNQKMERMEKENSRGIQQKILISLRTKRKTLATVADTSQKNAERWEESEKKGRKVFEKHRK